MQYSMLLVFAGAALALPAADPRPAPTAAADPVAAPIAAPAPTAMADPQIGFGVTTPFGSFSVGSNPNAPPGYNGGRPYSSQCNGIAAYCIYSSVSGSIYSSISGGIQDGILDAFGLNGGRAPQTTIVYVPTPAPYANGGYRPQQNQGGYQPQPGPNQGQPYRGSSNGGWRKE